MTEVFGPYVSATTIEDLALDVLRTWLESYLGWVERETERPKGSLAVPSLTPPRGTVDEWAEDVPPVLTLLSTGTTGDPREDGEGFYTANRSLGVVCFVEANSEDATDKLAKAYGAAILACLVQQPLGNPVEKLVWTGDAYDLVPREKARTLGAAQLEFTAIVSDVVSRNAGPIGEPQDDPRAPYPDLPTVETPSVTPGH